MPRKSREVELGQQLQMRGNGTINSTLAKEGQWNSVAGIACCVNRPADGEAVFHFFVVLVFGKAALLPKGAPKHVGRRMR